MSPLAAARAQMEVSLGFHMIFAAIGMAMPILMLAAEWRWMRYRDEDASALARTWARLTAVTFAIGAVSGTALSFELGLLWPRFMAFAGPLIGPAFALEGFAFFIEAIFLGLYLYGWERLTPRQHWLCGWAVAISGAMSGVLVLATNAWMQHPVGFTLGPDGMPAEIDPMAVLRNPAWPVMAFHATMSTYQAVGFAAAGWYAWRMWWRGDTTRYTRVGLHIAMVLATIAAVVQPLGGDLLAKRAHAHQPAKMAAMEGHFTTERGAPLRIGGWPDTEARETRFAVEIPGLLSVLAGNSVDTEVVGLDRIPRDEWPNVPLTHVAFQVMVGAGMVTLAVAGWYWLVRWRARRAPTPHPLPRALLAALACCAPLGYVALEAGWVVTEAGRQPWVIYKVMRTADAVTPVTDVWGSLLLFSLLYTALAVLLVFFLRLLLVAMQRDDTDVGLDALLAVMMLAALIAYAVLAGADFGAGVWDLVSRGPRAAVHRRALATAIGPVWEANHVWLIFLVVLLFTCFPRAYAAASVALFWPLHAILTGIVLRGAAFVFRAYGSSDTAAQARWGHVFGASSAITPMLLGMCLGAVSTGAVTADGSSPVIAWLRPLPVSMGLLALVLCAYLAAVYLAWEADDEALRDDFRRRALWCWHAGGVLSALTFALTYAEARHLWGGLTRGNGAALVGVGAALAPVSLWALRRGRFGVARMAGAAQVTVLLLGWGLAQWPYLIYPDITVVNAAAPIPTLRMVALALPLGLALLAPSLWLLFSVFKSPRKSLPD